MAQISDDLPDLFVRHRPCRHAGVSYAVVDVVKHLAVRQGHDVHRAKCGRPGVFSRANLGLPAPVVGMTDGTLLPEQVLAGCYGGRVLRERVDPPTCLRRHAFVQQPGRDRHLGCRRLLTRARQAGYDQAIDEDDDANEDDDQGDDGGKAATLHHEPADFLILSVYFPGRVQRRQLAPERFAQAVQRGLGRRIDRRPGRRREPIAGTDDDDRRASGAPQSRQEAADQVNGAFEVRSDFLRKVEGARRRQFWKRWRPSV